MFKTRPIRVDCPICKCKFETPPPVVDDEPKKETKKKGKKASEPVEVADPSINLLYQMMFDRQKINQKLLEKIKKEEPVAFFNQELKYGS